MVSGFEDALHACNFVVPDFQDVLGGKSIVSIVSQLLWGDVGYDTTATHHGGGDLFKLWALGIFFWDEHPTEHPSKFQIPTILRWTARKQGFWKQYPSQHSTCCGFTLACSTRDLVPFAPPWGQVNGVAPAVPPMPNIEVGL